MWNLCKRDRRPKTMVHTKTRNIFNVCGNVLSGAMYIKKNPNIYFTYIQMQRNLYNCGKLKLWLRVAVCVHFTCVDKRAQRKSITNICDLHI